MADKNAQAIFTPAGGMNQDDSIITPTPGSESGNSLFQAGDYRYALNARIGSSRYDSFGDVENIKDSVGVTDFYAYGLLVTNPDFTGSLNPWQEIPGPRTWGALANKAVISTSNSGAFISNIRYQPINTVSKEISVSFLYNITSGFTNGIGLNVVFLNGTTVISSVRINSLSIVTSESNTLQVSVPDGCNAVGFQMFANAPVGGGFFDLDYFRVSGYSASSKPSGTERVIGKYEDIEFQKLYFAVYNSDNNHSIRYYDPLQNVVFELIRWSGLKFRENSFVKFAKLDNWMAFTDRVNPPRLMDTNSIGGLFAKLGEVNFREFHISFHKWGPTNPPIPRVNYDYITNNYEKLKNKCFQFSYRFIYKGNLKSCWSPISKSAITTYCGQLYSVFRKLITSIEVDIPIAILDNPGANVAYNYFDWQDQKFREAIDGVELAYREGELDLWKIWKTIPINQMTRLHYYDGNANNTPLAQDEFDQPFDTVPFLAGTVEAIDNRFVFGDVLDELDPVTNIAVTSVSSTIDPASDWNDSQSSSFPLIPAGQKDKLLRLNSLSDFSFKQRGKYKAGIQFISESGWRSLVYTTDNWIYDVSQDIGTDAFRIISFRFVLPQTFTPPKWAVGYQIMRTNCLNIDYFMFGVVNEFIPLLDNPERVIDTLSVPQNIKDRVFAHFENSKLVIGEENSRLASSNSTASASLNEYLKTNTIFNSLAPEIRNTITTTIVLNASRIYIDIDNWYNSSKASATSDNPMNKLFYNYRQGDRIRFLASDVSSPSNAQKVVYDVPILEFTGRGIIIEKPTGVQWTPGKGTGVSFSSEFNVEVYSPKIPSDSDHIFYETGEWYPVLYPGTDSRDFSKRDWNYIDNNSVTVTSYGPFDVFSKMPFFYGDVQIIGKSTYRSALIGGPYISSATIGMNPDPSRSYDFWERNNGRPAPSYKNIPVSKFKPTKACFGGKIVEESFVNNVNRFVDSDQFIYPSEYGRIRDLVNVTNAQVESVGSIFLAIGERETWSIYVNRTTIEDLSGRTQVSLSNKILGSFNALVGSYGTLNPESISKYLGKVYYWDAVKGSWIRYGRDGLTPISSNKMRNWFKELGGLLLTKYMTDDLPVAISEFDPFNEELVTRIDHSSLPTEFRGYNDYKGSLFSEADVRWKSCHNYNPELFGKIGDLLVGFYAGGIEIYERGPGCGRFNGIKYDTKIEPVFNPIPMMMKPWQTISVLSTDPWLAERIMSEYRGLKTIQLSNIPLDNFEDKEDTYWAAVLNDVNSVNVTNPLFEGQKMRSRALKVLLTLNPEVVTRSLLHYVSIGYIESPKNPVN